MAARIANGFAENFIQANLDRKFESSSYARQFLEERIAQTKERLESAERQLVAYAANQQIINVGEPSEGAATGSATESLTRLKPTLLIEVHDYALPSFGESTEAVYGFLREHHYDIVQLSDMANHNGQYHHVLAKTKQ